ncbi:lyase family protein [Microbacterium sp. CFBP9034]|uniref:lyase family protein n=1 Tax=Microbacterium sp. CFBP9034 TaxID=3096540 RepID=UPI002A6B854B|nr:lyase family protein [Microbacterium sp. CFBP9034]MDY0910124.1 lyase family protein [Microbacterium sp. CFBP9034]
MSSDREPSVDVGLLSPVSAGHDACVSDAAIVDALVTAEVALARALARVGALDPDAAERLSAEFGWTPGGCRGHGVAATDLALAAAEGGNPVIPLVAALRGRGVEPEAIHRGATSQDILDTALMLVARDALGRVIADLERSDRALSVFAAEHAAVVAAARTLTQHAVPTTVGARAAGWVRGIRRALRRLREVRDGLPAQLGGAGGTLAATADEWGTDAAAALPAAFSAELGLATPDAPWHTERSPVTELGDALVQAVDAVGKIAADVAVLTRPEIGELAEGRGGGSSAMPQKQNPVASVLIRSAALRAPQLAATLHLASAFAVEERPDGAWHAEWPTLRELLRLALGSSAHAAALAEGLVVDRAAVARNLALSDGRIVSERLARVLVPRIGKDRFAALIGEASPGSLADALRALPEAADLDVDALLDPAGYTGLAERFVDDAIAPDGGSA